MTDTPNLPAIRQASSDLVADPETDSWVRVVAPVAELAAQIADTEFIPRGLRGSAPAVAAAILYGREVGLPPMTALGMTHVVEGRPGISAEGMRALVLQAGHELEVIEASGSLVKMRGRRRGSDRWTELSWNLDMARAAGVGGKTVWQRYPRAMLLARCTTDLCRMIFPDVIHGMRSTEELDDMADPDAPAGEPQAGPSTRVKRTRKRATPAKSTPPPLERAPERPQAAAGPPLPGEPGYDAAEGGSGAQGAAQTSGEGVDDAGADHGRGAEDGAGEDVDHAAPSPGPDVDAAPSGDDEGAAGPDDPQPAAPAPEAREQTRADADATKPIGAGVRRAVMAQFGRFELTEDSDRDERLNIVSTIVQRPVESTNKLTMREGKQLADTLARFKDRTALYEFLDALDGDQEARAELAAGEDQPLPDADDGGGS